MFDYCLRAKALGWAVVVADPHSGESPHNHLVEVRMARAHAASRRKLFALCNLALLPVV